jgi:hypothetical protein
VQQVWAQILAFHRREAFSAPDTVLNGQRGLFQCHLLRGAAVRAWPHRTRQALAEWLDESFNGMAVR